MSYFGSKYDPDEDLKIVILVFYIAMFLLCLITIIQELNK